MFGVDFVEFEFGGFGMTDLDWLCPIGKLNNMDKWGKLCRVAAGGAWTRPPDCMALVHFVCPALLTGRKIMPKFELSKVSPISPSPVRFRISALFQHFAFSIL
jgi:hypothetical protein